jgi:hypothetical protein
MTYTQEPMAYIELKHRHMKKAEEEEEEIQRRSSACSQ